MAYDKADWHLTDDFPKDLKEEQVYVHTGFFVGWLIDNDLVSDDFKEVNSAFIPQFKQKQISGPKLYELSGGVLSEEDVNAEGRLFCNYYFEPNTYFTDYRETFIKGSFFKKGLPSDYHVEDTWENYRKLAAVLDKRFVEWNKLTAQEKHKYRKTFDLDKLGINENHRAIHELFFETYQHYFEKQGFTYNKSNSYFTRNQKEQKEMVGLGLQFRGGCGHTIFPYFAISNKQVEKLYSQYTKGIKYLADNRKITAEYGPDKIERDQENWMTTWSPNGNNSRVEPILETVISFYETEGVKFFQGKKNLADISEILIKEHKFVINHPHHTLLIGRVCRGLIANKLAGQPDTAELIAEYRPFIQEHYSKGQWAYDKDAVDLFEKIAKDVG